MSFETMTNTTLMQSAFCVQCRHTVLMTTDQAEGEDEVRCVDHEDRFADADIETMEA